VLAFCRWDGENSRGTSQIEQLERRSRQKGNDTQRAGHNHAQYGRKCLRCANPATSRKQTSFGRLSSGDYQVVQIRRTVEVPTERAGPILDSGQRAEGNGISQRVEWRNAVFPIHASIPGEYVDGARLQGA